MNPKRFLIIILFNIFLFLTISAQAVDSDNVVINEIAWMGTSNSANDEWVELCNNSTNSINLEGWALKANDGRPEIKLKGVIAPNGFYLLERTDDSTIPAITADLIYKGALGNKGEDLKLYDSSNNLIDETNCSSGWFAGNNKTKQTMERTSSENWQTSQNPGGTPKTKNNERRTVNNEQEVEKVEDGPLLTYPAGIIFSEILPSPEGPDAENEWIELYNQNNFEVDLSGWKIEDILGKTTIYTISAGTKISSEGFLAFLRPATKITLNNKEDGLNLIQPNGNVIDKVIYEKAPIGESYNRVKRYFKVLPEAGSYNRGLEEWFWSNDLTPGKENTPSEKEETANHLEVELRGTQTAAIGEKIPKSNYLSTFLIAFSVAVFSGIVILILKRTLKASSGQ